MEIFELLAAMFDVTSVIVEVVSLIFDLGPSIGGDENRPR